MVQLLINSPLMQTTDLHVQRRIAIIVDILFTDRSIKAAVKVVKYVYKHR